MNYPQLAKHLGAAVLAAAALLPTSAPAGDFFYAVTAGPDGSHFGAATLPAARFSPIGSPLTNQIGGIGFAADGKLYGLDGGNNLLRINPTSGAVTNVGYSGIPLLSFQPQAAVIPFTGLRGKLYGVDTQNILYRFDNRTGLAVTIGSTGIPHTNIDVSDLNEFNGMATHGGDLFFSYEVFHVDANFQRTSDLYPNALYRLNPETGHATKVGDLPALCSIFGSDEEGIFAMQLNPDYSVAGILRVNPLTARSTVVNKSPAYLFFSATETPEPENEIRPRLVRHGR